MKPVTLSRQLTLEARGEQADGAGGYVKNWDVLGVMWAEVRAMTGRAREMGGISTGLGRYRVVVRAAGIGAPDRPQPGQRFREGTRIFNIEAVSEHDEAGRYLACQVHEEVAQ